MSDFAQIIGELRSRFNSMTDESACDPLASKSRQELRSYLATLRSADDYCLHQVASYLESHPQNPFKIEGNLADQLRLFIASAITKVQIELSVSSLQGHTRAQAHLKLLFFEGGTLLGYISNAIIWDRAALELTVSGDNYRKQQNILSKAFRIRIAQDASAHNLPGVPGLHLGCRFILNEVVHLDPYVQTNLLSIPFTIPVSTYALPSLRESLMSLTAHTSKIQDALNQTIGDVVLPFKDPL